MYGKIFESLFTGSLVGAGAEVFAVMSYVIANQRPDRELGSYVELNPKLLAVIIGESEAVIEAAIKVLCDADPNTTTPGHQGKRLISVSRFGYQVVNGAKYRAIRDEEDRRRQNREAKRRERAKKNGQPLPGEVTAVRQAADGDHVGAEAIAAERVPRVHEATPPGPAEVEEPSEPEAEDAPVEED